MMFRRLFTLLLLFALSVTTMNITVHAQTPSTISIYLDGQKVNSDVSPYIIPKVNVTMVPLRVISEGLGAEVSWSQSTQTAMIQQASTHISMGVGKRTALVNDASITLDASVQNKQGRVMVPIRFVAENLGLQVNWDQPSKTILLQTGGGQEVTPPPDIIGPGTVTVPVPTPSPEPGPHSSSLKGVWVSTVYNLDWPSAGSSGNIAKQQQEFVTLLDDLQSMNMNTVFVQVRPSADALYPSKLVPWSKVLTGTQGKNPGYDPLAFMIEETHKRGMEFQAWFNPFRANTDAATDKLAANHVAKLHPDWIVNSSNKLYINPGIPQARQHIIATIMEVVNNYAVDGVHLDDYFYPSDGKFADDAAFKAYN
ncbi:MAG: family 10 glycosylhydrolase, partial [Clostridia bacterium]